MNRAVYTTATTGTVHMIADDFDTRTLCGRDATAMVPGDETVSGISATCAACLKIVEDGLHRGLDQRLRLLDPLRPVNTVDKPWTM